MVKTEGMSNASYQAALQVAQQAIAILTAWTKANFFHQPTQLSIVAKRAMEEVFPWQNAQIKALRLLFAQVKLNSSERKEEVYYCPAVAIENSQPAIPYPQTEVPSLIDLQQQLRLALEELDTADWSNLSLLTLMLEKYGSFISFEQPNVPLEEHDTAFIDLVRMTSAIAAALVQSGNFDKIEKLSLVAGDLSGIQKFIYTISSDGALKSLRARSFYLELVTEEIVQQLLTIFNLPRTNIIYAGGGNLYLITSSEEIESKIKEITKQLNNWLWNEFQGKIFLALDYQDFNVIDLANDGFRNTWNQAIKKLNQQKTVKFQNQENLLKKRNSHDPCRVCHRDDTTDLKALNPNEDDSVLACSICRQMFQLGNELFRVKSIVRSYQNKAEGAVHTVELKLNRKDRDVIYYHLFTSKKPVINNPELVFLINNWTVQDYQFRYFQNKAFSLLLGNYGKESEKMDELGFMRAGEFAELAEGIDRVGYLRMDVDRLGQIFAQGLKRYSLPRLAGLSRQMSYFFKVYLNSLAKNRQINFLESKYKDKFRFKSLTCKARTNLLFIYAGGDDLFVSGSWNEIIEFSFDVYQSFRAYTGFNPDITLSSGISIEDVKFPLYQAAASSGKAEEKAKGNGRDSLGLFDTAFKWVEWLGANNDKSISTKIVSTIYAQDKEYWNRSKTSIDDLNLLGVLPFVTRILQQQIQPSYSRNFVRNLLVAAQLQEQYIKEIEKKQKLLEYDDQIQDIRYYLHLPQIAYTLARLPKEVFNDEDFRKSLKSPYNAPYFRAIATWIEFLSRE